MPGALGPVLTALLLCLPSPADGADDGDRPVGECGAVLAATGGAATAASGVRPVGRIVVDPRAPRWLRYRNGGPLYLCAPGNPEDFLYRGTLNRDGTRSGDQTALIDKLARTGANGIYFQIVRSHGGDGAASHNPFVGFDPARGLNPAVLDQWEAWLAAMADAGIVAYMFFFDDGARIWARGHGVPPAERAFLEAIVRRFKHHGNIVWVIAEEYSEAFSARRVSNMAAVVRAADDAGHPIAVHKPSGLSFREFADDPNIDQFAIQYNRKTADQLHRGMVRAFADAAGRYGLNMSESKGHGTGATARRKNWAVAMGGAHVMVLEWDIASTPAADLRDCGRLARFMESADFRALRPRDDLAFAGTRHVLARPGDSYVAYAAAPAALIGLRDMTAGRYDLRWFDPATGAGVERRGVEVAAGDRAWRKPAHFGDEVALHVRAAKPERRRGAGGGFGPATE